MRNRPLALRLRTVLQNQEFSSKQSLLSFVYTAKSPCFPELRSALHPPTAARSCANAGGRCTGNLVAGKTIAGLKARKHLRKNK